jgi:hypothetical protein
MGPSAIHESGHFYFAQTGHSHFAATPQIARLTSNGHCYRRHSTASRITSKLKGKNHEENHIPGPQGSVSIVFARK